MFAGLYGELVPHAWRGDEPEHDAYSLFYHRSLAMGWLDDLGTVISAGGRGSRAVGAPGLWAMNDAGWNHPLADGDPKLVSWFQVEASAVAGDRPLPVQPFLRCAEDTTARIGTPHLSAIQVLLPVQGLDAAARPGYAAVPAMRTTPWFAERDPRSRTPVLVGVNSGRDPSIPTVATRLIDHLRGLDQDVFGYEAQHIAEGTAIAPPFDDRFWNGPPRHGIVLHGELVEWSGTAVGWLAEVIADTVARLGVATPVLVTAERVSRPAEPALTTASPPR